MWKQILPSIFDFWHKTALCAAKDTSPPRPTLPLTSVTAAHGERLRGPPWSEGWPQSGWRRRRRWRTVPSPRPGSSPSGQCGSPSSKAPRTALGKDRTSVQAGQGCCRLCTSLSIFPPQYALTPNFLWPQQPTWQKHGRSQQEVILPGFRSP